MKATDSQVRDRALDTTKSFIVQAPAGSGKTTLLISRFLCLLVTVNQPEEILAMTFTRKATEEMRNRILKVLDPNASDTLPQSVAQSAVLKVRERSKKLGWNLQDQPTRLQIKTIDALNYELVRNMPWSSRLGSVPRIGENSEEIYYAAAQNTIESANLGSHETECIYTALAHVDNHANQLTELIVEMLKKRDQWLRILREHHFDFNEGSRAELESAGKLFVKASLDRLRERLPRELLRLLSLSELNHLKREDIDWWSKVANALLVKTKPNWRKRYDAATGSSVISRENFSYVLGLCKQVPNLNVELDKIGRQSPYYEFDDDKWEFLRGISQVLLLALAHLKLEFSRRGEVDYIEVAQQAIQALGTAESPTDLMLILDHRYQHILVDEFQDTSISQRDLIESLIEGWEQNDGRTLFMVGDPMQSIYRFREAEVGIFLSVVDKGLGNLKIEPLQLTHNFRSKPKLVDWYNEVFKVALPERSNALKSEVAYASSTSNKDSSQHSVVQILIQPRRNEHKEDIPIECIKQMEAERLVDDVTDVLKRVSKADEKLAILVRNRSHCEYIIPLLKQKKIKYYAENIVALKERLIVKDLLSLIRALFNLEDRISWFAVLRAPWCGLSLEDMTKIASSRVQVWKWMQDDSYLECLSDDGIVRIKRIRSVLKKSFLTKGQLDVRQWIEDTWTLLGGPACVSASDFKNAKLFLDRLEQYANRINVDILQNFEAKLIDLYAVPDCSPDDAQVHISTIHNAKGLEYDAVFLPSLTAKTGFDLPSLLEWSEVLIEGKGQQLLMSPRMSKGVGADDPIYKFVKEINKQKDLQEITRLAYVACTRAKKELYLYSLANKTANLNSLRSVKPLANTLFHRIFSGIVESGMKYTDWLKAPEPSRSEQIETFVKEPKLIRLPRDWQIPVPPASLKLPENLLESPGEVDFIEFNWAGTIAVWIGMIVHKWLERISNTGLENWSEARLKRDKKLWIKELCKLGMNKNDHDLLKHAIFRIETALINVLNDNRGRWILDSRHREAKSEYRMTGLVDGIVRNVALDRTFVDRNNIRWIVDYKVGTTRGNKNEFLESEVRRYREQLLRYRKIIAGFEDRDIRTGLYFPMFPAWREIE